LITGISGYGSDVVVEGGNYNILAYWRPPVMDRWIALVNYLGARYDSDPNVEAIIPLSEIGVAVQNIAVTDPSYSLSAITTQYLRLAAAVQTSWPTTNKILFNNWAKVGGAIQDLTNLSAQFATDGWGMGGPDIIYMAPYGAPSETYGEQIVRGAGGAYGAVDYRGTTPIIYEQQANAFNWVNQTSAGTEDYAYSTLEATHVVWTNDGLNGNSMQQWSSGVLPALVAVNFRTHATCPTIYTDGCNTQ
jgi:hypothetical protein